MRFRSPTEKPIRLALLSGHTAVVGPEWRDDLPELFHYHAVQQGCLRDDNMSPPVEVEVEGGDGSISKVPDADAAYRAAILTMLERNEEGDFTKDSLPNINAVSKLCGFAARKEDVLRVFRALKEEAGAAS